MSGSLFLVVSVNFVRQRVGDMDYVALSPLIPDGGVRKRKTSSTRQETVLDQAEETHAEDILALHPKAGKAPAQ